MSKVNRDLFKPTPMNIATQQVDSVDKISGSSKGLGSYAEVIKLKDNGKYKVRVFPAHPSKRSYFEMCATYFLPVRRKKDNGEMSKGKFIFDARFHGDQEKDIVDEFIKRAIEVINDMYGEGSERAKGLIFSMTQFKQGATMPNIQLSQKYMMYANVKLNGEEKFGRVELGKAVVNKMNEIAIGDDDTDSGVIQTDPFTDLNTGRSIFITKNWFSGQKPGEVYKVSIDLKEPIPLTDEEIISFSEKKPLEDLYKDVYTKNDFNLALEGLEVYSNENLKDLNMFRDDKFMSLCAELEAKLPEATDNPHSTKPEPVKTATANKAAAPSETVSDLPFDKTLDQMDMEELKGYIRKNRINVNIIPIDTVESVRDAIKSVEAGNVTPTPQATKSEAPAPAQAGGVSDKIAALRAGLQ